MKYTALKIAVEILTGLIALTAIGGGLALLSGAEGARFPLAWLQGTPFHDYSIPAVLLTFLVGGSSLLACLTLIRGNKHSLALSMAAGLILIVFIVVEASILQQNPSGPSLIEKIFFFAGVAVLILADFLWIKEHGESQKISTRKPGR